MGRGRVAYDAAYLETFRRYAGSRVEKALNTGRVGMLERYAARGAAVLDIGVGSGAFLDAAAAAGFRPSGFDINPRAVAMLRDGGRYAADARAFDVVTFWDSIEHMEAPDVILKRIQRDAIVLVAIPVFDDLARIRESRHYKPGEHLLYFTPDGFIHWMALRGFRLLERSDHETAAGRDSIGAFAFKRDLPDYHDHVAAYTEMHASRHYGSSATELHLETVARVVRAQQPRSILDYGCGRSDLVAHFWNDGARRIARYDPAIPMWKQMPEGDFDLALVCDVMEHIPMASVDRVLAEVRGKAPAAVFTISTKLARAKLPDGRNAHVTLLTRSEWRRWIADYFGPVEEIACPLEHELVLVAGAAAADIHRCPCGGEAYVDSYERPGRAVEWFLRCLACGAMSEPVATEKAARGLTIARARERSTA